MTTAIRHLVRAIFSLLLMAAVAVLGQWPLGDPTHQAVIRLSLRSTRARVEVCRDRSPEELEALPVHMREPRICDVYAPDFRLEVAVDGKPLVDRIVSPGGVKGDRPLILNEELVLEPGSAMLKVTWIPVTADAPIGPLREALSELPRFELQERVELIADRITLVELDDRSNTLEIFSATPAK